MGCALRPGEIIVDSFAGGGGASLGIEMATGRSPDIAINHSATAIAMHRANHPTTRHYSEDVWKVDPVEACAGRPVGLMWLSPDCKHFSKAKGGKPVSKKVRGLAWVAVRWATAVRPRIMVLENVEEFQTWGPVSRETGKPYPDRKGETFRRFVGKLRRLGYAVEWKELRACDYGAPTSRRRLFLVARCDGEPIVWPKPTHGPGRPQPWRTAAECIDWSLPCPSIFLTPEEAKAVGVKRPLADATMRRIARGVQRYVLDTATPFIVSLTHQGGERVEPITEPMRTVTAARRGEKALVVPTLIQAGYGERKGQAPRVPGLEKPLGTVVAGGMKHALVTAFLAKHFTGVVGSEVQLPLPTITTIDHHALVASTLVHLRGGEESHLHGDAVDEPLRTISAGGTHAAEVRAFLVAYYGNDDGGAGGDLFQPARTVTTRDRMGLVTVHGTEYAIVDIGMRMLTPRELFRAQGFPDSYIIDVQHEGRWLSKSDQVQMCGNSVSPPNAAAIVAANLSGVAQQAAA